MGESVMIQWKKKGLDTCFYKDGQQLARAIGAEGCEDSFEEIETGVFCWKRECRPAVRMVMELRAAYSPDFTMIPGVNYNGNGEPFVSIHQTGITGNPGSTDGTGRLWRL